MRTGLGVASLLMLQFLAVSAVAMLLYEGGNRIESDLGGYSIVHNTFSDLGRTSGYNGTENQLSRSLFTASLAIGGAGLILYHALLPQLFRRSNLTARGRVSPRMAGLISAVLGTVCGIAFIGIGVFPADAFRERHFLLVYVAFTMFLPAALFGALAFGFSKGYPVRFVLPYALLSLLLLVYLALIYFGPPVDAEQGNVVQVIAQKVVVYLGLACIAAEAALCRRRLRRRRTLQLSS